jgi:hypothetical protein
MGRFVDELRDSPNMNVVNVLQKGSVPGRWPGRRSVT